MPHVDQNLDGMEVEPIYYGQYTRLQISISRPAYYACVARMLKKWLFSRMSFAPARLDVDPSIIDSNLMMVNLPHFVKSLV